MNEEAPRILIADDESFYRETTAEFLREEGFQCICVENAHDAIDVLQNHTFDLILSDLNMPGNLKLELLREGRTTYSRTPMIIVTGVPSTESAIESLRLGVTDYLLKPVKLDELLVAVQRALTPEAQDDEAEPDAEAHDDSAEPLDAAASVSIIGNSPAMREVLEVVERVAFRDTSVLITGESGTGKEIIARTIHQRSRRSKHRLQVIDCTAIPEALFESTLFGHVKGSFTGAITDQSGQLAAADRGTVFFDELGELPLVSQSKLLRVIQEQTFTPVGAHEPIKVDVRFVCATNRDLEAEVNAERFRRDLFYRLAVIHMELPPLRARGEDIELLAEYFMSHLRTPDSPVSGFSQETLDCFRRYRWPGNIRELRNVVERSLALATGNLIEPSDLPAAVRVPQDSSDQSVDFDDLSEVSRDEALDRADRVYLTALLERHGGVIARAARQAGLSRQGMNKLLKRHRIDVGAYRK